jgi:hypothetical protein
MNNHDTLRPVSVFQNLLSLFFSTCSVGLDLSMSIREVSLHCRRLRHEGDVSGVASPAVEHSMLLAGAVL